MTQLDLSHKDSPGRIIFFISLLRALSVSFVNSAVGYVLEGSVGENGNLKRRERVRSLAKLPKHKNAILKSSINIFSI